jgi:hypothetical protein
MLFLERKRTERSPKAFLLMRFDLGGSDSVENHVLENVVSMLPASTREADITGWYKELAIRGTMFTEFEAAEKESIWRTLLERVTTCLESI